MAHFRSTPRNFPSVGAPATQRGAVSTPWRSRVSCSCTTMECVLSGLARFAYRRVRNARHTPCLKSLAHLRCPRSWLSHRAHLRSCFAVVTYSNGVAVPDASGLRDLDRTRVLNICATAPFRRPPCPYTNTNAYQFLPRRAVPQRDRRGSSPSSQFATARV